GLCPAWKEFTHPACETTQYVFAAYLSLFVKQSALVRAAIDRDRSVDRVRHPHHSHLAAKILLQLLLDLREPIARRQYFDRQFQTDLRILRRHFLVASVAPERNVGPAHRIWTAIGDEAGIVGADVTELMSIDEVADDARNPGANHAMGRPGR